MALPVLANGPYIFNVNNVFYNDSTLLAMKNALLQMKNALVALGGAEVIWKVVASSDAVTAINIEDAGEDHDLWIDTDDLVNSGEAAHSWCILEHQTTGVQLSFDYNHLHTGKVEIRYSVDGTYAVSGGTTSAKPTATEYITIVPTSNDFLITHVSTYLNLVIHAMASADHKCTRLIIQRKNTAGLEETCRVILIEEAVNTPSQWTSTNKTVVWYNPYTDAPTSTWINVQPKLSEFQERGLYTRLETAEPYAGWVSVYPTTECVGNFTGETATPAITRDYSHDVLEGYPVSPIGLYNPDTGSHGGVYGKLRDLYFAPYYNENRTTYPADASRLWIKFGCLLMPWNGSAPELV